MRAILCLLVFYSCSSFSNSLYKYGSQCEVVQGSETIRFQSESRKMSRSLLKNEKVMEVAKKRLYKKVTERLADYNGGLVVKKARFFERAHDHFIGTLEAQPVDSCKEPSVIITENTLHLLTDTPVINLPMPSSVISLNNSINNTRELNLNDKAEVISNIYRKQEVKDTIVSPKRILGIAIGDSFEFAETKFGRFSLIWPLDNGYKLALLGRKNAFLFKENILVQYQYSPSLLPIKMRNLVEMSEFNIGFKIKSRTIQEGHILSESDMHELNGLYGQVTYKTLIVGDMTKELALKSLVIGDAENHTLKSNLACLSEQELNNSMSQSEDNLISLVDYKMKRAFLSGCNQLVLLDFRKEARELTLLDNWGNINSELINAKALFNSFKPWNFFSLTYGDDIEQISTLGSTRLEDEVVDFKSQDFNWEGSFVTEHGKLLSANLVPIGQL